MVTKGTLIIGAENDSKGTPIRAGDFAYVRAKWIHWAKCGEQDCMFYMNVDGPDSYIEVTERRP